MIKKQILVLTLLLMITQLAIAQCNASQIYTQDGLNEAFTCPQDENADIITFSNNDNSDTNFAYTITNSNHEILNIVSGSSFDFNAMSEGNYYVWGFSYTGSITATVGESVFSTKFSNDCYKISRTAIKVVSDNSYCIHDETVECQASIISTISGQNRISTCRQDNNSDILTFTNNRNTLANFIYVITDKSYKILNIVAGNSFNFDTVAEGEYIVWGFSYTGNITGAVGEHVFHTKFTDRCWKISRNCIEVTVKNCPDSSNSFPSNISTTSGETMIEICTGDGFDDLTFFENDSNNTNRNYAYIITDDQDNITAFPPADNYNFDGISVGTCHVWGISYTGIITAQIGDNINTNLANTPYQLSNNHITVVKKLCGSSSLNSSPNDVEIKGESIIVDIDEINVSSNPENKNLSMDIDRRNNRIVSSINEINISPNPTSDKVFIDFEMTDDGIQTTQILLSIYSTMGQLLSQKTVATAYGQNRFQIDLSVFNSGLYRIVIQNGQTIKTKTVVKVN